MPGKKNFRLIGQIKKRIRKRKFNLIISGTLQNRHLITETDLFLNDEKKKYFHQEQRFAQIYKKISSSPSDLEKKDDKQMLTPHNQR